MKEVRNLRLHRMFTKKRRRLEHKFIIKEYERLTANSVKRFLHLFFDEDLFFPKNFLIQNGGQENLNPRCGLRKRKKRRAQGKGN